MTGINTVNVKLFENGFRKKKYEKEHKRLYKIAEVNLNFPHSHCTVIYPNHEVLQFNAVIYSNYKTDKSERAPQ